jgi:hypothetical protein
MPTDAKLLLTGASLLSTVEVKVTLQQPRRPKGGAEVELYSFFNLGARWMVGRQHHAPATVTSVRCITHFGNYFCKNMLKVLGRRSSVGIATRYSLDLSAIESRWVARFFAPVHTGPGAHPGTGYRVFPGGKAAGACIDHPPHLAPKLKKE